MNKFKLFLISLVSVSFFSVSAIAVEACLITKTDINPFFVKMKEGAEARANELGIKLSFFAGITLNFGKLFLIFVSSIDQNFFCFFKSLYFKK